ncbi:hypothetical protein TNCT_607991 [Trichonephila clavata]|uniref:Uncharacterized protein n=1 Tax=Trichonephila clavata TaxID=2740835 RepID=A0A8X6M0L4_TRICU|nr:hypothetical protein TNCT_607991 [Trichonephila clavata]
MPHVSLLHSYGVFQCLCYADGDPELRRQEARVSAFDDIVAGFRWLQLRLPVGLASLLMAGLVGVGVKCCLRCFQRIRQLLSF